MKFRNIIEDILIEQASNKPFYYPSGNGVYSYSPGGLMYIRPKGSVNAQFLFPNTEPKQYPKTITQKQVDDISKSYWDGSYERNGLGKNQANNPINSAIASNTIQKAFDTLGGGSPPYQPPTGWQEMEKSFAKFNEPMGKINASVRGKYRMIPAQVNQYYWDGEAKNDYKIQQMDANGNITYRETSGAWVKKSIANVDSWRDVPAGFLPSEYDEALEWVKQGGTNNEYKGKQNIKASPYYHKNYPLGISLQDLDSRNKLIQANKDREAVNKTSRGNSLDVVSRNDTVDPSKFARESKMSNILYNDSVKQIDDFYGRYKQAQQEAGEEGFNWVGFLVTVASFIPVTAPFARVVSGGLGIMKAIQKYEKGDAASAGLDLLFTFAPGASKLASEANILNAIKVGKESTALKQVLEQHADEWFSTVKSGIATVVQNSTAKALANVTVDSLGKEIKDNLGTFSIKYGSKVVAKTADNANKKQQVS